MPTVARIGAIRIRFYYEDHGVPHFHAISPDFDFKFAIVVVPSSPGTAISEDATSLLFAPGHKGTAMSYI
jgi:Domain of unknown function (DUF4160)